MTAPAPSAAVLPGVTALAFDVFGTCVDWRTTVADALHASFKSKADSPATPPGPRDAARAISRADCDVFAQRWRASYWRFTEGYVPGGPAPWKDVDAHHRDSLAGLLDEWGLGAAYSGAEVEELSRVWHRLAPWGDSAEGLRRLGPRFRTAALWKGNREILEDLNGMVGEGWAVLMPAGDFGAYKPHPAVYEGAISTLGVAPGEVALVAAHMRDLEGARGCGMKTVYVERLDEERGYSEGQLEEARGWVDVWVSLEEEGLVGLARRLGC